MLEGLEISIQKFKELDLNNPTYRLDSEFFKKEYKELFNLLSLKKIDKAESLCSRITQGPNPVFSQNPDDIPCLTGRNINKGRVNYSDADYVSIDEYNQLNRFQIKKGDTLITLKGKGSIGKVGFVTEEKKAIFSRDIGILRPSTINNAYLNAYILSYFGKKLIERGETGGTGQSTLTASYLKNLDVARLKIEDKIGELIYRSENVNNQSQIAYIQAENLILEDLGLKNFTPQQESINIKSFKNSFEATGRLDAEYYQLKYEDYLKLLKSYSLGFNTIQNICNVKDKNFSPEEDKIYQYIELSNIGDSGNIISSTLETGKELPSRARRLVHENDVIISSIEGSLQSCALVTSLYHKAICSTGFYVINSSLINSESLLVLFKSEIMQNILKQNCSGTILTAINKTEFLNIPIPLIEQSVQIQISKLIQESFALKNQSEQLLEIAKKSVEIAIEEEEAKALDYIKENT